VKNRGVKLAGVLGLLALVLALASASYGRVSGTAAPQSAAVSSADPPWLVQAKKNAAIAQAIPKTIVSAKYGAFKPRPNKTIYHIACNLALEGCTKLANGIKSGVKAIGYKFKLCDGGTTADTLNSCFTNAINAKPAAIVINGIGVADAADQYARVAKAGIPIVGTFTGNPPRVKGVATEVAGDVCAKQSRQLADTVIADSNGKANVMFVGTQTYTCNIQRQNGFVAEMKKCTTCTTTTMQFAISGLTSQLPQQLQAALQSHPDLTYIVGTFDAVALAATDAVRSAGKSGQIKVLGYDGDAPNLALVQKGDIQIADNTTGATEDGWAAADAAARAIAGKKMPAITSVTSLVVTKNNYGKIPGGVYNGPTGFRAQFLNLWGKR
jgi:ribose transport system substrate-binding protein